ncbi:DUF4760 domain-containing protein [Fusibacter ferrireducens]|nr:hypothetical protein [Fusibacter ferrireducens]
MKLWSLEEISSIASVVELIVVIISIIYAKKQLDDSVLSRRIQLLREIISEVGTDEIRELRSWLYNSSEEDIDLDKVRRLAVAYDRISFMLLNDRNALKLFREFQGNEIIQIWEKVESRIRIIRDQRKNPDYCIHFEKLYLSISTSERKY